MSEIIVNGDTFAVMISEKALPIQSVLTSGPRFSKRKIAMRSTPGLSGWRLQAKAARHTNVRKAFLQYTRLQRQKLLEFR